MFGSGDDDIVVVYGIGGGDAVSCIGAVDDFALSFSPSVNFGKYVSGGGGSDNCSFCRLSA